MAEISPIAGVTLDQYAQLCAAMAHCGDDQAAQLAIAAEAGVSADAWAQAKAGFTARMSDPADMGRTAMAFMPLFQAAQSAARGGGAPCSLALFTEISASYSFERDAQDQQVPPEQIFARHGLTGAHWNEYTSYWTPKVNDPNDPAAAEFRVMMQAESDRIFGIYRNANGSRVDPEDEDEPPADRAAARAALAAARRPVEGNPTARSPGAGPIPSAPPPPPAAAAHSPAPPRAQTPPPAPPPAATRPAPESAKVAPPAPPAAPANPNPFVAPASLLGKAPNARHELTEGDRMWAAIAHACVLIGCAGWGPTILWLMYREPGKSPYVAFHAKQAMIVQWVSLVAIIVLGIVTCGLGTVLLVPYMGFEAWLAWQAWQGSPAGYPGMATFDPSESAD